ESELYSVQTTLLKEQLENSLVSVNHLQVTNDELENTLSLKLDENIQLVEKIRKLESDTRFIQGVLNLITHQLSLKQLDCDVCKSSFKVSDETNALFSDVNMLIDQFTPTLEQHQAEVKTAADERDLVLIQLGHVQEELENYS